MSHSSWKPRGPGDEPLSILRGACAVARWETVYDAIRAFEAKDAGTVTLTLEDASSVAMLLRQLAGTWGASMFAKERAAHLANCIEQQLKEKE